MTTANAASGEQRALWRQRTVRERSGLPRSTMYRLIERGEFPAPIPLFGRAVAWDSTRVQAWIDSRIDAASKGAK